MTSTKSYPVNSWLLDRTAIIVTVGASIAAWIPLGYLTLSILLHSEPDFTQPSDEFVRPPWTEGAPYAVLFPVIAVGIGLLARMLGPKTVYTGPWWQYAAISFAIFIPLIAVYAYALFH